MKTFLEHVAQDIINKYGNDLSRVAVVFPNKRASLFMNEHLAHAVDKPLWSPAYITISDLFRQHTKLVVGDQIKLICDLYKTFQQCTGTSETLDHFYGWGQLLLADFDDVDKNMADAERVFSNLKEIHELDDISYLNEEQKQMLKKFFSNFSDDHNSELKKRFLNLWSHFGDIYHDFNRRLEDEGLAYEGALYRKVALDETVDFCYDTYIFVGFNVLQRVEQRLFSRLQKMGRAKFYWDFDKYYMDKANNEAGHYVREYLKYFPNELDNADAEIYDNMSRQKDIDYISATTENIQARYISTWLKEKGRMEAGTNTAIVLCDESLLQTVIHCIPPEVTKFNITTGYPLSQSPISSLVTMLVSLQTAGHVGGSDKYKLHYVNQTLHHPCMKFISEKYIDMLKDLDTHKRYYPSRAELTMGDEGLSILFSDIETNSVSSRNASIAKWMLSIIKLIGKNSKTNADPLFQESVFRMHTLLTRLSNLIDAGDLDVDLITFQRLISQLVKSTSIPFHGEPAVGVQIMGVLETRNLDFDHVLVLSCNEGNMPKGVNDASFIPYSIRKAYGLTTIDNKVAIYAYYFHSLLQRASDISLLYNSATEEGQTGEMSRFMLQMLVESSHHIKRTALQAQQIPVTTQLKSIDKDDAVMDVLNAIGSISPTAINRYLRCQLQFYYNMVAGIKEPDENDEDQIDNRVFGNIFHKSAELLYRKFMQRSNIIHRADIEDCLKHPEIIEIIVDQAFREELFKVDRQGFRPEYNGLQIINREVIIGYLRQLLEIDIRLAPFLVLALEQEVSADITLGTGKTMKIKGYIDRLDSIKIDETGEQIRVIDYKTGNTPKATPQDIDEIFAGPQIPEKHTDYYLQSMLYSCVVRTSAEWNPDKSKVSPALLFIQHAGGEDYDPILKIGKDKILDIEQYRLEFQKLLADKLTEIFSPGAFVPTDDKGRCNYCPYKGFCGI